MNKYFIQSTRNSMSNAHNPYQGKDIKVLCVCSAGLLRSATMMDILVKTGKYNVRNCGTSMDYALIPLSSALLQWADKVVVVKEQVDVVNKAIEDLDMVDSLDVIVLDIPDIYCRNDPDLINIISNEFKAVGLI